MKKSLIIVLIAMVTLLQADYIVKYNMDGEIMEFMYKNSTTSKMVTNSEDGKVEIYHIKKNSYLVSHGEEGINVVDLNEMKAKANAMGFNPAMYAEKREKPKFTIQKTGKRVTVGGIKGEEWIVKGKEDGQSYKTKVVVTSDKNVLKTMRAMFASMSDMSGGMVSGDNPFEMKKGYVVIKADGMKLESFKNKSLSSKTYQLPVVTNTREAFNERNKRSAQPRKSTKKRVVVKDTLACYDNPCCGNENIAGQSVVLEPAVYKSKGGVGNYILDSATCKKNALGQTTEVVILENSTTGHLIHLKLVLNDKSKGIVQKLIDSQTDYGGNLSTIIKQEHLNIARNKAMYIVSRNTNQQRMDIYLGNNATLSMARMNEKDWLRSFQGWAEKGWLSYRTLKKNVKNWDPSKPIPYKEAPEYVPVYTPKKTKAKEPKKVKNDSDVSSDDVDKAVNLLKGFF